MPQAVGGGLVLGGALGNLSERIVGGHAGRWPTSSRSSHWPTFNVADACITVGVIIVMLSLLFEAAAGLRAATAPVTLEEPGPG